MPLNPHSLCVTLFRATGRNACVTLAWAVWLMLSGTVRCEEYGYDIRGRHCRLRETSEFVALRSDQHAGPQFRKRMADMIPGFTPQAVNEKFGIALYSVRDPDAREAIAGRAEQIPVFRDSTGFRRIPSAQIIVRFKADISRANAAAFLAKHRLTDPQPIHGLANTFITQAPDWRKSLTCIDDLSAEPEIAWAEPDFISERRKRKVPNDPSFTNQWHLRNTGQSNAPRNHDPSVHRAWDIQESSSNILVAIIDDGIQTNHPDLAASVRFNLATNASSPYGNDPSPISADDDHGTPVAGIVAAVGNNALGVAGAAYGCGMVPIRINLSGLIPDSEMAAAILHGGKNAHVQNNSWGTSYSQVVHDAIKAASASGPYGKGCLVVFALGNDTMNRVVNDEPSTVPESLVVGALNNFLRKSAYSDYGQPLDVAAASNGGSAGIVTTDRTGTNGNNEAESPDGDYDFSFGGTSAAAPLAAAIAALAFSKHPDSYALQIRRLIEENTDKADAERAEYDPTNGWSRLLGYGAVNALKILEAPLPEIEQNEPNNNASQAVRLRDARLQYGSLTATNDVDWFYFDLTATSQIQCVTIGTTNTWLRLYNSSQTLLIQEQKESGGFSVIVTNSLAPGKYYLTVSPYQDALTPAYGMDFSILAAPDAFEPDNTTGTASAVGGASLSEHSIWPVGDQDWFMLAVTNNQTTVALSARSYEGTAGVSLYDSQTNLISDGYYDPDAYAYYGMEFPPVALQLNAGIYYVRVAASNASDVVRRYNMHIRFTTADANESDDDTNSARLLLPDTPVTHTIYPKGDEDWSKIIVPSNAAIIIYTDNEMPDTTDDVETNSPGMRMSFYNATTSYVRTIWSSGNVIMFASNLTAGTYFIKTSEYWGDYVSRYDLVYHLLPTNPVLDITAASNNAFAIKWESDPFFEYRVDAVTDLVSNNWTTVSTMTGGVGETTWSDSNSGAFTNRFYRVFRSP